MEDKATFALICTGLGTALGLILKFVIDYTTLRRKNAVEDRNETNETIRGLYNEVKADQRDLRDKYTASIVEIAQLQGIICRQNDRLREHGLQCVEDSSAEHPKLH